MKIYMFKFPAYILVLLLFGCSSGERNEDFGKNVFSDIELRKIYDAADQRDYETLALYAHNDIAAYRMAYARCMGSVQDTAALPSLYELMRDPIPYVRMFAAFAVGQYRDSTSLPALEKAFKKATIPEIKSELLEAIGKSADANAMDYLIFHEPSTALEEAGKMWGIYHASLRGLLKQDHLRIIAAHLKSKEVDTRLAVLNTLNRQKIYDLSDYRESIEEIALQDKNPELRTAAVMAMRHIKNVDDILIKIATHDDDPRVRASAILSIEDGNSPEFQSLISVALEDGSAWVAMNAANRLSAKWSANYLLNLEQLAITSTVPEVKTSIVTAFLSNDSLTTKGMELWKRISFKNSVEKAVFLKALGYLPNMLDTLIHYSLDDSPLGTAATEGIITGAGRFEEWKPVFYDQAMAVFEKGLIAQSYLYANASMDPKFFDLERLPLETMEKAVTKFSNEGTIETRNELRKAIANAKNQAYTEESSSISQKINWDLVETISTDATAILYMGSKTLRLKLLIEDAPGTVSNFVALAEKGFYDGKFFHRVVPVFVSQGGGPRGDGFGSTDYTIRSEFSPLKFGSGVAGIASAGKDTESCQFFFTHIPTPHLNGRYTIFGALTDGFSQLSDISTGTQIDSVRINY